jgi:putative transposase
MKQLGCGMFRAFHGTPLQVFEDMQLMSDPEARRRRSIRLSDYNYAQNGAYFITICTQQRYAYFEDLSVKHIAEQCWQDIPLHFPNVDLDEWIVMPNHLHGIFVLTDTQISKPRVLDNHFSKISPHSGSVGVVMRAYKASVSKLCRRSGELEFAWQRNYYEHILRSEDELNRARRYIVENPTKWDEDEENPKRVRHL